MAFTRFVVSVFFLILAFYFLNKATNDLKEGNKNKTCVKSGIFLFVALLFQYFSQLLRIFIPLHPIIILLAALTSSGCTITAFVLAIIGLREAKTTGLSKGCGQGYAITSLILGSLFLAAVLLFIVAIIVLM